LKEQASVLMRRLRRSNRNAHAGVEFHAMPMEEIV